MNKVVYVEPITFLCHASQNESNTYIPYEPSVPFFDGKCEKFIEGHRCVPFGHVWIHPDGREIEGELITPWKPYNELAAAQAQYELMMAEAAAAYREGVNSV